MQKNSCLLVEYIYNKRDKQNVIKYDDFQQFSGMGSEGSVCMVSRYRRNVCCEKSLAVRLLQDILLV